MCVSQQGALLPQGQSFQESEATEAKLLINLLGTQVDLRWILVLLDRKGVMN